MLGRILLILLQLAGAWFAAHFIAQYIPLSGEVLRLVLFAVLFAVMAWIIGLVGAEAIKGVNRPQGSSFALSLGLGLLGAAVVIAPLYVQSLHFTLPFPQLYLPLIGAVAGYQFGR
jgi:hypothetical protein